LTVRMEEICPSEILGFSKLQCYNWEDIFFKVTFGGTSNPTYLVYSLRPLKTMISMLTMFCVSFLSDETSTNFRNVITVYIKMAPTVWEVSNIRNEADAKIKARNRSFKISCNSTEPYHWILKFRFQKW
jgi:hypothetical protein